MVIAGIIAEYNPFHNGHAYHVQQTKRAGATHVVAVMSGNFVQRGDIAICSKWARARMALQNGVDLVVELPAPYACSSANTFAFGGVYLLNQLGADLLSFGCESNDIAALIEAASIVEQVENSDAFRELLKSEKCSYVAARQKAAEELYGLEKTALMLSPNNVLGIEYIRAINKIGANIIPVSIKRRHVLHDSIITSDTMASASRIRDVIKNGSLADAEQFMPYSAHSIFKTDILLGKSPVYESGIEQVMLYKLRTMTPYDFSQIPDVSEGLHNRLYATARQAETMKEFYSLVKTKRYTHARIRRIAYCSLIGITKSAQQNPPSYIRVLGATKGGMEILANCKAKATIPVGSKFANLFKLQPDGITLDIMATDIFSLAQPTRSPCGMDFIQPIIKTW